MGILLFFAGAAAAGIVGAVVCLRLQDQLAEEHEARLGAEAVAADAKEMLRLEKRWREVNTEAVRRLSHDYGQL